jgi:flagellar basal body-associated protein FliL
MDAIREQTQKPLVIGIVAFVVGLILGLVFLGWWLMPVEWYDASPANLHAGYQEWWMRMAVESYQVDKDPVIAKERYDALGEFAPTALGAVKADPQLLDINALTAFEAAVSAVPVAAATSAAEGDEAAGGSNLLTLLGIMCVVTLLLGAALLAFYLLQNRRKSTVLTPAEQAATAAREAEMTDYAAMGEEAPMAQFMASYRVGDDLFDDSFSIDSPNGEFMGECGVGISETIGVGDPKKVTAFEVWLFDKNDIQTVTKVLMSTHAFNDPATRQKLEAKGEPVLAESGSQAVLETATLRLVARIVDLTYGEGALPEQSFFDGLVLELAVWQK